MKVQDVFGNVNGFMEFLILIFKLISFYTNYRLDYFLFNMLVEVKFEKSNFTKAKGNENKVTNYAANYSNNNNYIKNNLYENFKKDNFSKKEKIEVSFNNNSPIFNSKVIKESSINPNLISTYKQICKKGESELSIILAGNGHTTRKLFDLPDN
jgi:hypothetical protein